MRNARYLPFLLFLTACAQLGLTPPKASTPQDAINEANILVISVVNAARDNFKAGMMTLAEKDKAIHDAKAYVAPLDEAQSLLDAGKMIESQDRVKLINIGLLALQKRVNEKRTKQ
jgi:hypothetical protein